MKGSSSWAPMKRSEGGVPGPGGTSCFWYGGRFLAPAAPGPGGGAGVVPGVPAGQTAGEYLPAGGLRAGKRPILLRFDCQGLPRERAAGTMGAKSRAMYELDKQKFGAFVAALRKEKGMTQRQLAGAALSTPTGPSANGDGVSVQTPALLQPWPSAWSVTATELLLCGRAAAGRAAGFRHCGARGAGGHPAGGRPVRAYRRKSRWMLWYLLALVVGAAGAYADLRLDVWMGGSSGAQCCWARVLGPISSLPHAVLLPLYDQHKLNLVSDGIVRMNVPGAFFGKRSGLLLSRWGGCGPAASPRYCRWCPWACGLSHRRCGTVWPWSWCWFSPWADCSSRYVVRGDIDNGKTDGVCSF